VVVKYHVFSVPTLPSENVVGTIVQLLEADESETAAWAAGAAKNMKTIANRAISTLRIETPTVRVDRKVGPSDGLAGSGGRQGWA
jgi:hypothetical protein